METKFIEGTNEQYSIREDGVVIKNYIILKNLEKVYKKSILQGNKDPRGQSIQFNINKKLYGQSKLLIDYFGSKRCKTNECTNPVTKLLYSYCSNCRKLGMRKADKKWKLKHHENYKLSTRTQNQKSKESLSRNYIAANLHIPVSELTDELYESKRNLILFKRKLSKEYNMNISSFK